MVDDVRGLRDALFRTIVAGLGVSEDKSSSGPRLFDLKSARDLLGSVAAWAGKGKDEIVQILCREIGSAMAMVLKEPVTQVLKGRKLQITFELIPKSKHDTDNEPRQHRSDESKSSRRSDESKSNRRSRHPSQRPK